MGGARVPIGQSEVPGGGGAGQISPTGGRKKRVFSPHLCVSRCPPPRRPRTPQGGPPRAEEAEGRYSLPVFDVRLPPLSPLETASRLPTPLLPCRGLQATVAPADTRAGTSAELPTTYWKHPCTG